MRLTLAFLGALGLSVTCLACGDGGGGSMDSGNPWCPRTAPDRAQMAGLCCARVSNVGQLDAPDLRMAGLNITAPITLTNAVVGGVLSSALDTELFVWLLRGDFAAVPPTITTGYGIRNATDGTYTFDTTATYPPVTIPGALAGEVFSAAPVGSAFTVPVFEEDGVTVTLELPLDNLEIVSATFSEDRSCIGSRRPARFDNSQGTLAAFVTVAGADSGRLRIGPAGMRTIDTTLCMFTAGMGSDRGGSCATTLRTEAAPMACPPDPGSRPGNAANPCGARACVADPAGDTCQWPSPPDSLCMAGTCTKDPGDSSLCTPLGGGATSDCNAWFITAEFSAQGVDIL